MKRITSFTILSFVALILLSSTFVSNGGAADFVFSSEGTEAVSSGVAREAVAASAQFSKYFVTTAWVKSRLASILLIDTRDEASYAAGHITGAINVPSGNYYFARTEGTDGTPIKCMIPTPAEFIKLLNKWGVKNSNTIVVTYGYGDDLDWGLSARLTWTLKLYGHQKAYNMDGGFPKWKFIDKNTSAKYLATTPTLPTANTKTYVLSAYSDVLATKYDVLTAVSITDTNSVILDSRTPEEYNGSATYPGNPRAGHIPNAVELTWTDVFQDTGVTDTDTGKPIKILKTEAALRALLEPLVGKTTDGKTIMPYCEAGFRSAHVTNLLLGLGYPSVRHYQGSWSEWSRQDPTVYPAVTP